MSEEKTEEPTHKKLEDARKKGQVGKSADIVSTCLLIGIFAYIGCDWNGHIENISSLILFPIQYIGEPFQFAYQNVCDGLLMAIIKTILPVLGICLAIGISANYVQIGGIFSFETVKPDLKKLNPMDKAKQMFSKKNLFELLKSSLKIIFLGILIFLVIKNLIQDLLLLPFGGIGAVLEVLGPIMVRFSSNVVFAYIVMAIVDLFFQKRDFKNKMKMTKQEIKQEYKEMEGDPQVKGQRKQLHREMIEHGGAPQKTKNASALVTNPTHLAIAIYYEESMIGTKLPIVIAKGKNAVAEDMKKVAKQCKIPVIQNVPLAHALYDMAEVMKFIPVELIEPVATVMRWVYDLRQKQQYAHYSDFETDSTYSDSVLDLNEEIEYGLSHGSDNNDLAI